MDLISSVRSNGEVDLNVLSRYLYLFFRHVAESPRLVCQMSGIVRWGVASVGGGWLASSVGFVLEVGRRWVLNASIAFADVSIVQ